MDTKGWILMVLLTHGVRADLGPQQDCVQAARAWMHEARAWERRSGMPQDAMWVCVPPEVYEVVRVRR